MVFFSPHGKNQFHPPDGNSRLTVISIFSLPHGDNQFSLRLTAIINFSLPHARINFIPPTRRFTPHGDNNFSLPHGDNQFFFASRQESISFRLHGDSCHTALLIFSSPHGANRFFFAPRKILLTTHQGFFMRGIFSFLLHPF
jgi:hypothetical protein